MRRRSQGFTLVELMVTVVIVAVLAVIAVPSYQEYVRRGNRSAAQSYMMAVASKQEQYLLSNRAYAATLAELSAPAPQETEGKYSFALQNVTAATYEIAATATGSQLQDGDLLLSSTGAKTPAEKWKR